MLEEGGDGECGGCWVAAGVCDEGRVWDFIGEEFGEAVGCGGEVWGVGVWRFVDVLVEGLIVESVVC